MNEHEEEASTMLWVIRIGGILGLVSLSALFSGLTLGLMSLDKLGLEVVIGAGEDEFATPKEKQQADAARRIAPIRKDGNLLLTTLLLGNVAVNSLLSIMMADITSGLLGFVVSTVIIVLFGEIFPQAACSRHALAIGAKSVPLVRGIIAAFYPFAKPVSLLLDHVLGKEVGNVFTKKELWKMLDIHVKQDMIDDEESWIMYGALHYKSQKVSAIYTPIEKVFMIPATAILTASTIRDIYQSGFSRIPVWNKTKNDIVGLLFVRDLVFINPSDCVPVHEFIHVFGRGVHRVWPDSNLGDLLKAFKLGRSRLALVQNINHQGKGDPFLEILGIVTLEDVVEEILQDTFRNEGEDRGTGMRRRRKSGQKQIDYTKMRLLGVAPVDDYEMFLTPEEANEIALYLVNNQPLFQSIKANGLPLNEVDVAGLLSKCPLVTYGRSTGNGIELYSRAHVANHCLIVLEGSVKISSGDHGMISEKGPWTVLGGACLVTPANSYLPDFSATISNHHEKVVCLLISHVDYQQMIHPISLATRDNLLTAQPRGGTDVKRFQVAPLLLPARKEEPQIEFFPPDQDDEQQTLKQGLLAGDSLANT